MVDYIDGSFERWSELSAVSRTGVDYVSMTSASFQMGSSIAHARALVSSCPGVRSRFAIRQLPELGHHTPTSGGVTGAGSTIPGFARPRLFLPRVSVQRLDEWLCFASEHMVSTSN